MTTEKKHKKDKEVALELEYQIKEVKHQLTEQLKCLDGRLENHFAMTAELSEFYQRRSEVEMEYAKSLDKIVRQILTKHKAERQKRENWQNYSTYKLWQTLLEVTSKQSRCHATFSESLSNIVATKFAQMRDDMTYIYRKCYEIATSLHAELHKSMTELHSFLKTYQQYHGESKLLQSKLNRAETQKSKVEQDNKKGPLSKKLINFDKKTEKHRLKVQEGNLKALKARNEYLLSIDSTNAALRKYFIDDLPDLINAMDYSYHISLGQIIVNSVDLEATVNRLNNEDLMTIANKAKDLNQISDRQVFLQLNHQIFSLPKRFDFLSHKGDMDLEVQSPPQLRDEMVSRVQTITDRLHALKLENDELWKTLETTDNSMVAKLTSPVIDPVAIFQSEKSTFKANAGDIDKLTKEKMETQNFYFNKFKNYELNSNLAARLQAKCLTLEKVLSISKTGLQSNIGKKRSVTLSNRQLKRRALGKFALEGRPKLFGGSIREYVNATGQEIPLVIRCCTKIINLYGMHHQGVFRIPGLQHEINEYKNMFERGEEPILVKVETRDINSVAGVLKLYFRELSEPLFPLQLFDELVACSKYSVEDPDEFKKCIERLQELLLLLPRSILIIIRYLFSFLNHLSEYSDENMMDAHNLSVCFGPTLIPVPPDHDPVNHQNQINELVRILIVYQEKIFPNDGGVVYEKFIVDEENDLEESVDNLLEGAGGDGGGDDVECRLEAVALHDFAGRTQQEVTMKKGDTLKLFKRVSSDWWEGATNEQTGLIPHKFIAVCNRRRMVGSIDGEDKLFVSTESLPSRSVSVSTSIRSSSASTGDPFDRSVSQPNICESPPPLRPDTKVGRSAKDRTDSALSSNSTITFSESSFSNLSDDQRISLESAAGARKDSTASNKDEKELRKLLAREGGSKSCDCSRRSGTLERRGESFSPLIPVLEIIEPIEVVLEVRDPPQCCSATVAVVDSTETSTTVSTTRSIVDATRGPPSCFLTSLPVAGAGLGYSGTSNKVMAMVAPSFIRSPPVQEKQMGDFRSSNSQTANLSPSSKSSSPSSDTPLLSATSKDSPEKSPLKVVGPHADSYFSFSLKPLEGKPPLPAFTKSSLTSPGKVSPSAKAADPPLPSPPNNLPDDHTSTAVISFSETTSNEVSVCEETVIEETSTLSEGLPVATAIREVVVVADPSNSLSPQLTFKTQDPILSSLDSFPPPPDELLSDAGVTEQIESPPLPSFFSSCVQNKRKQGDLPQQLDNQFAAVSESIATASLKDPKASSQANYSLPLTSRQSRDLVGSKSLDVPVEPGGPTPRDLSTNTGTSSTHELGPSTFVSASGLTSAAVRMQGVGSQASPRLSALSMNLPTLSLYTTLSPKTTLSSAQVSASQGHPVGPSVAMTAPLLSHDLAVQPSLNSASLPSQDAASMSSVVPEKNKVKPPPTMKKPGAKI